MTKKKSRQYRDDSNRHRQRLTDIRAEPSHQDRFHVSLMRQAGRPEPEDFRLLYRAHGLDGKVYTADDIVGGMRNEVVEKDDAYLEGYESLSGSPHNPYRKSKFRQSELLWDLGRKDAMEDAGKKPETQVDETPRESLRKWDFLDEPSANDYANRMSIRELEFMAVRCPLSERAKRKVKNRIAELRRRESPASQKPRSGSTPSTAK